ncbi:MAG: aminoacyl-tRNA hydrolase [Bdellovibrionia bacterium]
MKIIAGLGNPGPKYEVTRHNIGFLAIDRLVDCWSASGPTSKYQGELYQATYKGEKVILVKPQTFMNLSGRTIAPLFSFYQCTPSDLIVIHDDLDLDPMVLRLKTGGGAGGHNGLKSIDECLGKDNTGYHRVRLGIGHPSRPVIESEQGAEKAPRNGRISPADYVLQCYGDEELTRLDPLLDDVVDVVGMILQGQIKTAMNQYHHRSKQE